jgi:hypothetical protein
VDPRHTAFSDLSVKHIAPDRYFWFPLHRGLSCEQQRCHGAALRKLRSCAGFRARE